MVLEEAFLYTLSVAGMWELMSPRGGVIFNPSDNICWITKQDCCILNIMALSLAVPEKKICSYNKHMMPLWHSLNGQQGHGW